MCRRWLSGSASIFSVICAGAPRGGAASAAQWRTGNHQRNTSRTGHLHKELLFLRRAFERKTAGGGEREHVSRDTDACGCAALSSTQRRCWPDGGRSRLGVSGMGDGRERGAGADSASSLLIQTMAVSK